MSPAEDKAVDSGRNFYYEGQHGAEEPADVADRLRLVRERDALRARCEAADALLCGIVSTFGKTGDIPLASIDAHLKGAGRE